MDTTTRDFSGRTAIVTGGSRGLGAAVVRRLAARGARVVVLAREPARLHDSVRAAIDETGAPSDAVIAVPADVSSPDSVRAAFATAGAHFGGRLDWLVNNAGVGNYFPIPRLTDAEIAREIGINFTGAVYCTREAVPLMAAAGGGRIVNVSTEGAQQPVAGLSIYGASKAALEAFSLATNLELRAERIKATVLRIGRMQDTFFSKEWPADQRAEAVARWQQEGRFAAAGTPMPLAVVADTLVGLLALGPEAQARLVDIREFDAGV